MLSSTTLFAVLSVLALTGVQARPTDKQADKESLDYLANKAGKRYLGTAIQSNQLADPTYVQILESQFDAITPENEMKWEVIQPTEGNFNFTGTDAVSIGMGAATFAKAESYFLKSCRSSLKRRRPALSSEATTSAGTLK